MPPTADRPVFADWLNMASKRLLVPSLSLLLLACIVFVTKFWTLYATTHVAGHPFRVLRVAVGAAVDSRVELAVASLLCLAWSAGRIILRNQRVFSTALDSLCAVCVLAMALINIANVQVVPILGSGLTGGMLYYSDFFGSANGRTAVASWIDGSVKAFAVGSLLLGVAVFLLGLRVARRSDTALALVAVIPFIVALSLGAFPTRYRLGEEVHWQSSTITVVSSLRLFTQLDLLAAENTGEQFDAGESELGIDHSTLDRPFKNAILIVLESTAAQYLDVYGGTYLATPNLDRLSNQSVVVESAYSHAVSSITSMGAILSSQVPLFSYASMTDEPGFSALPTFPGTLKENGIESGLFFSSDTRYAGANLFLETAGFDIVSDYRSRSCGGALLNDDTELNSQATPDVCTFADMLSWIDGRKGARFASIIWTFQSHWPYFPTVSGSDIISLPPLEVDQWVKEELQKYVATLREADALIGRLITDLEQRNLLDDTLIIVTGDHGEAFGQHGTFAHGPGLYEEEVHVPLILINPRFAPGSRYERVTGHIDIAPTILDAMGVNAPQTWMGTSLFRERRQQPTFFFTPWTDLTIGYRYGAKKAIVSLYADRVSVFDLARDPREEHPLVANVAQERARVLGWARLHNAKVERLLASFGQRSASTGAASP